MPKLPKKPAVKAKLAAKPNRLIGTVRAVRDGFGFVELEKHESVSLSKKDMRSVFPGDLVEVRAGEVGHGGRIQGSIAQIIQRNTTELVGQLHTERDYSYVRPSNSRITQDIHIPEGSAMDAREGQIVVVNIVEQPGEHAPAFGRVKEILGDELSAGMEIKVALHQFDIPHEWPEAVEDEADGLGSSVKTTHKAHRLDLRQLPFVTIDGEDARDFDDAVYTEKTAKGWRLMVAIADVSHYVKPQSALDIEAQERGTSVYFPEYVVPMLPEVLSNGLCSLKPKVDRLALVCDMEIDRSGRITDFRFAEAVIRSHERLTYTRVATALAELGEEEMPERYKLAGLCPQIDELNSLFKVLTKARAKRGAMEFESQEVRFEFNENRKIEKIVPIQRNDAHKIIEECMLCANICAADFLEKNQIPGLYRVHLPPADERLSALREYLAELGLALGGGDEPTTADFQKLSAVIENRVDKGLIQAMVLRSQQQAVYQPQNKGHFGLAYSGYAHFTSPIRRYPDLLVHRAIRALIRSDQPAKAVQRVEGAPVKSMARNYPYDLEVMETLGVSCSLTERRAEEATRDVAQWLKCEYLQQHLGDSFMGVVASVTKFGLFVQIMDLYVEGLIHIANLPNDYYEYDSVTQRLIGQSSRRTFKVGDKAMVQVARVNLDERQIDLMLTDSSKEKPREKRETGRYSGRSASRSSGRSAVSKGRHNVAQSSDDDNDELRVKPNFDQPTASRNLRNRVARDARGSSKGDADKGKGLSRNTENKAASKTNRSDKDRSKPSPNSGVKGKKKPRTRRR